MSLSLQRSFTPLLLEYSELPIKAYSVSAVYDELDLATLANQGGSRSRMPAVKCILRICSRSILLEPIDGSRDDPIRLFFGGKTRKQQSAIVRVRYEDIKSVRAVVQGDRQGQQQQQGTIIFESVKATQTIYPPNRGSLNPVLPSDFVKMGSEGGGGGNLKVSFLHTAITSESPEFKTLQDLHQAVTSQDPGLRSVPEFLNVPLKPWTNRPPPLMLSAARDLVRKNLRDVRESLNLLPQANSSSSSASSNNTGVHRCCVIKPLVKEFGYFFITNAR